MGFLYCFLSLILLVFQTGECLPGGYSQVGFAIYNNKQEYDAARNSAGMASPHAATQGDKVLVTYAVGHPGTYDTGSDLSNSYYELTPQFSNHGQHQRQVESYRQGLSSQPAAPQPNYYTNTQAPALPARPVQAQVHYSNPYLQTPQEQPMVVPLVQQQQYVPKLVPTQSYQAPVASPSQVYRPKQPTVTKQNLDLSRVIPGIKNNPALTSGYGNYNAIAKEMPKPEAVNQNNFLDAAIDAALDDRFPVQYFRK